MPTFSENDTRWTIPPRKEHAVQPESRWAVLRLNAVFFGGLFLWTLLIFPIALPLWCWLVIVRKFSAAWAVRSLIHFYGAGCCRLLGSQIPLKMENRAGPLTGPCIIAANHQSFFDPYCIGFFPFPNQVFVARSWPFRIPLYGRIMRRAGYLNSEELDQEAFFQKAAAVLREGAALVVFPEGTRSATGGLGRFRSGAFKLAMELDVPIVPMCINGACRVFPKKSRFGRPAPVRVTLLPPVYPAQFRRHGKTSHRHLQKNVKLAIFAELESHAYCL